MPLGKIGTHLKTKTGLGGLKFNHDIYLRYIPYYYDENNPYNDYKLKVGNVIAIEPTLVTNDLTVKLPDEWGVVTSDMSFGTSWEHTVVITDNGKEIVTKTDII